jgi:hypothetical protein
LWEYQEAMKIFQLNWGEVNEPRPSWSPSSGTLWAVWPSPIDHDLCLRDAGVDEFDDTDSAWNVEFSTLLEKLIKSLAKLGEGTLIQGEYPVDHSCHRVSLCDALIGAATDDNFHPCMVTFGAPPVASLRTSYGHAIIWVWLASGYLDRYLDAIADGRHMRQRKLRWANLY